MDSVHSSVQEFTFAQLSPPAARHALDQVQQALPGSWWDHHDSDGLVEAITQRLAYELGNDSGRPADLSGVEVTCWDVDTGDRLMIQAVLDASNAPALPWNGAHRRQVSPSGPPFTLTTHHPDPGPAPDQLSDAALAAMAAAWQAGHTERDRRVKRNVLDWIAGAQPWFTADGTLLTDRPRRPSGPAWGAAERSRLVDHYAVPEPVPVCRVPATDLHQRPARRTRAAGHTGPSAT